MTTSLDALYDQDIATCVTRRECLVDGADLPTDPSPATVGCLDQRSVGFTPEELDERTPGGRVLERIAIEERNQEVHPERECLGDSIQLTGECPSADRPGQHSEPTSSAHRHSEIRRSNPSHPRLLQRMNTAEHRSETSLDRHGSSYTLDTAPTHFAASGYRAAVLALVGVSLEHSPGSRDSLELVLA